MNKFIFDVYRFLFSTIFLVSILVLIGILAGAYLAVNVHDIGSYSDIPGGVAGLVMIVGFIALFLFLILGDFAAKITIANQLVAIHEELRSKPEVSTDAIESGFKDLSEKLTRISKRLQPPIQVHAVKPKPKEDQAGQ